METLDIVLASNMALPWEPLGIIGLFTKSNLRLKCFLLPVCFVLLSIFGF